MKDKIDERILETVSDLSGSQVTNILNKLRGLRSETQLRVRLNSLDTEGYIFLDRQSAAGKVFVSITPFGLETLAGRKDASQPGAD